MMRISKPTNSATVTGARPSSSNCRPIAGAVCALATSIKGKVRIDDALDVGAVHFVGGAVGALLIGFFGDAATGGANGGMANNGARDAQGLSIGQAPFAGGGRSSPQA